MLKFLYNICIYAYYTGLWLASFFHPKAKLWIEGRKKSFPKLQSVRDLNEKWFWFHCCSMGEYEDSVEICMDLKRQLQDYKLLLTVSSPTAYEELKNSSLYSYVMYLPLDTVSNAKKFLNILKPEFILFSRSELWVNYLNEIRNKKIKTFLIALRMSHRSNFLIWPAIYLYKSCFSSFTHIFCQTDLTQVLLEKKFQYSHSSMIGNPRIHRIIRETKQDKSFPLVEKFINGYLTLIGGSVLSRDLHYIHDCYDKLQTNNIKLILVPHEIDESEIKMIESWSKENTIRYSNIKNLDLKHKILIVDHVGDLRHLYKYCHLAVIGGGFNRIGIHSIIEPAAYGIKPIFGPHHKNYPEVEYFLTHDLAEVYKNSDDLSRIISQELLSNKHSTYVEGFQNYFEMNTPDIGLITKKVLSLIS